MESHSVVDNDMDGAELPGFPVQSPGSLLVSIMLMALSLTLLAACGSDGSGDGGDTTPAADSTQPPSNDATQASGDPTQVSEPAGSSEGLLEALLEASRVEAERDDTSDLYRVFLEDIYPCQAEAYVELFGSSIESPYDAESVRTNAASGARLSLSMVESDSQGSETHLLALGDAVDCFGGIRVAVRWDLAFQFSDSRLSGTAAQWLDYSECILNAVEPSEPELLASHYYWYYDDGGTAGPLEDPQDYLELQTELQSRTAGAHGDSLSFDDPCVVP